MEIEPYELMDGIGAVVDESRQNVAEPSLPSSMRAEGPRNRQLHLGRGDIGPNANKEAIFCMYFVQLIVEE